MLENSKRNSLLAASGSIISPTYRCTVHKQLRIGKQSTIVSGSFWANTAQENHLCNVGSWQTDNFYEENNLYNIVSIMMGQHCIEILSSQYCPNTSEITLHKEITCAMLAQSVQTRFCRKITCTRNLPV